MMRAEELGYGRSCGLIAKPAHNAKKDEGVSRRE